MSGFGIDGRKETMPPDLTKSIDDIFGGGFTKRIDTLIKQYRKTQNLALFDEFKFDIIHHIQFGDKDKNFYQKQIIVLWLSRDFQQSDKSLIIWLITEFCKSSDKGFWVDLRSVMALLGFMLYKYMDNDDLPILYQTKFGACSDSVYSVDIEIVLGFGIQETLAYLDKHKNHHPMYPTMIKTIKLYDKNKKKPLYTYDDYCQFFEKYRFQVRQEEIAQDCGL